MNRWVMAMALFLAAAGVPERAASGAGAAPPPPFTVEPPAGWSLVPLSGDNPTLILSLKGPEKSSFVLARINPVSLENRAAVRTFLSDVLSGINARTHLKFRGAANVETASYANGVTAICLRADLDDKPRMTLAVMEVEGVYLLGTLVSAVPETLLPSILGSLKGTGTPVAGAGAVAESADGQLRFILPPGLRARALTPRERKLEFVAAFEGSGVELLVLKSADDGTPVKDQPEIVKGTVLAAPGVQPKTLTPVQYIMTSAGPDFIYASARVADAAGEGVFLAGYMPWAYWGYSILAKGAKVPELAATMLGSLSLGSAAVPKLVAASPRMPVTHRVSVLSPWTSTLILILLVAAVLWFWWRNQGA
ncbi:MAG: hypothetical protein NTY77_00875 [Elusimicrobia bacterium]|nr:hypothetical protein [Elusimicrobiota bacterium]